MTATTETTATNERTSIFGRNIVGNILTLAPTAEATAAGIKSATFDFSRIPGFVGLNPPTRIVMQRAIGQLLTQTHAAGLRDEQAPDSCHADMLELFDSIVKGTYTGRDNRVAKLAAAITASKTGAKTRAEAEANPKYAAVLSALQAIQSKADKYQDAAEAVAIPDLLPDGSNKMAIDTAKKAVATAKKAANGERAVLAAMFATPEVAKILATWYPVVPKVSAASNAAANLLKGL